MLAMLFSAGLMASATPGAASAAEPAARGARAAEQVAGADVAAWAVLSQRRPSADAAIVAYREFVLSWPDSPLAEAAWDRLVALGAATVEADSPAARQALTRVRARWTERQRTLAVAKRSAGVRVVLDLDEATGATALVPIQ